MNATWSSGVLRWIAARIARLAEDLEKAACYAPPLDAKDHPRAAEDHVFELRNRLSRYY